MATSGAARTPTVGDSLFFEGLPHRIQVIAAEQNKVQFVSELTAVSGGVNVPRFRTAANLDDLMWSDRIQAWTIWGRVLGKGRGDVGEDQRRIVADLRDRRLLAARETRERGQGPTGGEQFELYLTLFRGSNVNWKQELSNARRGEGLSTDAQAMCAAFEPKCRMKYKYGYAAPHDGDKNGLDADKGGQ